MIDLQINEKQLLRTIERAKERDIIIPTFEQQINPKEIPDEIKKKLPKQDFGILILQIYSG